MSSTERKRLLEHLKSLRESHGTPGAAPRLHGRNPATRLEATLLDCRTPSADPLTGFRDAGSGLQFVARSEDLVFVASLGREATGLKLRGQLSPTDPRDWPLLQGGIVHVRTDKGVALAPLRETGEFCVGPLPSSVLSCVDLELEDRVLSVHLVKP